MARKRNPKSKQKKLRIISAEVLDMCPQYKSFDMRSRNDQKERISLHIKAREKEINKLLDTVVNEINALGLKFDINCKPPKFMNNAKIIENALHETSLHIDAWDGIQIKQCKKLNKKGEKIIIDTYEKFAGKAKNHQDQTSWKICGNHVFAPFIKQARPILDEYCSSIVAVVTIKQEILDYGCLLFCYHLLNGKIKFHRTKLKPLMRHRTLVKSKGVHNELENLHAILTMNDFIEKAKNRRKQETKNHRTNIIAKTFYNKLFNFCTSHLIKQRKKVYKLLNLTYIPMVLNDNDDDEKEKEKELVSHSILMSDIEDDEDIDVMSNFNQDVDVDDDDNKSTKSNSPSTNSATPSIDAHDHDSSDGGTGFGTQSQSQSQSRSGLMNKKQINQRTTHRLSQFQRTTMSKLADLRMNQQQMIRKNERNNYLKSTLNAYKNSNINNQNNMDYMDYQQEGTISNISVMNFDDECIDCVGNASCDGTISTISSQTMSPQYGIPSAPSSVSMVQPVIRYSHRVQSLQQENEQLRAQMQNYLFLLGQTRTHHHTDNHNHNLYQMPLPLPQQQQPPPPMMPQMPQQQQQQQHMQHVHEQKTRSQITSNDVPPDAMSMISIPNVVTPQQSLFPVIDANDNDKNDYAASTAPMIPMNNNFNSSTMPQNMSSMNWLPFGGMNGSMDPFGININGSVPPPLNSSFLSSTPGPIIKVNSGENIMVNNNNNGINDSVENFKL